MTLKIQNKSRPLLKFFEFVTKKLAFHTKLDGKQYSRTNAPIERGVHVETNQHEESFEC